MTDLKASSLVEHFGELEDPPYRTDEATSTERHSGDSGLCGHLWGGQLG